MYSIAVLAALGYVNALELNVRMALNNGATKEEIVESFFQVAAWDGLTMAGKVFRQMEEEDGAKK